MAIYMPLLLMGVLALSTYWLVRNTPGLTVPEAAKEVGHEVDYFMRNFTIKSFDESGKLKSEIHGTEARHFPDTDILEIDQVKIRSINPQGLVTTATAVRAYANSDGSEVQLAGNARVVREASQKRGGKDAPRLEFRGEFLHVFLNEERVKSHQPVVLIRGADQFTGNTFSYSNLDQVAVLTGRVRGVMMPKSAGRAVRSEPPSTISVPGR
ncbi:MAG: LPS export ABC transporter periplasmic protein LptC [Pseudomonadota bacterium]|nr:LPS export ABC transporter periplasmic protein LptC [Pseudomonadota bacterium]